MNTAGLGGVGGPYRLDSGNTVFQVSDFDKDLLPEEVPLSKSVPYFFALLTPIPYFRLAAIT
jgi:hypothetical protein